MEIQTQDNGERDKFLQEFVQIKVAACYIRDYRNYYGRWVTGLSALQAIASVGSVAGWLSLSHLAWLWATLLMAAQIAQALRSTFPFAKKRLALSRWCRRLDELVLSAQGTWDDIESGKLSDAQIRKQVRLLRTLQLKAQARAIPNGLPKNAQLFQAAQTETALFFEQKYDAQVERL